MALMYRSMLPDGNRPLVGPGKKLLGVKTGPDKYDDIAPDEAGNVHPRTGGMSVAPSWRELPQHRIPKRLRPLCPKARGSNDLAVWFMGEGPFQSETIAERLNLRVDKSAHGMIEPASTMALDEYLGSVGDRSRNPSACRDGRRMIPTISQDTALSEYIRLLLELHQLFVDGRDESVEADELRDRMDAPWRGLDADEVALVDGLSADLYSLGVARTTPDDENGESADFGKFQSAVEKNRWVRALEIVREHEESVSPRIVAFLRGFCWAHLHEPDVAILFLQEAARLEPLNTDEELWLLMCATESNRQCEFVQRAREIADTCSDMSLVLEASIILFGAARQMTGDTGEPLLREAIRVAECGLANVGEHPSRESLDSVRCSVLLHLALEYGEMGKRADAIEACRKALELDPERQTALTLLGFLTFDQYSDSQRASFRDRFHQELATAPQHEYGLALLN